MIHSYCLPWLSYIGFGIEKHINFMNFRVLISLVRNQLWLEILVPQMLTTVCFRDQIFTMNSTYKYAINKNTHLNEGKSVQFDIVVISTHLRYESKHTFTINVSKLNMKNKK